MMDTINRGEKPEFYIPEEFRKLYPGERFPEENGTRRPALPADWAQVDPQEYLIFNVPFWGGNEELWKDHPMLAETDGLFAESTDSVVDWLLKVRNKPQ